ncbi:MAG: hypothetical protein AAFY82_01465 [Pseudomonadota bacterium]
MRRALAALLIAVSVNGAALAEDNIAGHWTFEAKIPEDCSFGGTARLEKTGETTYTGELTATQSCPALPDDYVVRQECDASKLGNQLSVRCRIVEFVNGFQSDFYYPDNFTLTIESGARMYGALVSAGSANPAEWIRAEGGIS